jgi:hypothetical protein
VAKVAPTEEAMSRTLRCIAPTLLLAAAWSLGLNGASPATAQGLGSEEWAACLKAPDRACVLDEAIGLVQLLDRTPRRAALTAAVVELRSEAGEISLAVQLARQIPDGAFARITALRAIAVAQAKASHAAEAEQAFDQALQAAFKWHEPMGRAEAL